MTTIKVTIAFAPYMANCNPTFVDAYKTREDSRFAAAKAHSRATSWDLRHVASGLSLGSMLPPRSFTLAEVLGVIKALEAHSEIDYSPLDAVEFGKGFTKSPPPALLGAMRQIAADAL